MEAENAPPELPTAQWTDTSLSKGVCLLLKRIGLISFDSTLRSTSKQSYIDSNEYTHDAWLPLIPQNDAQLLLALVPASLRPAPSPWPTPSNADPNAALYSLARLALEPSLTFEVFKAFRLISVDICGRWLDMLGLDDQGRWHDSSNASNDERQAVVKVLTAFSRIIAVFPEVFPFVATLLRHPGLAQPPIEPASQQLEPLTASLLTLLRLLYAMPHLPTSQHTSTSSRPPWSLPTEIEQMMKSHPHRGIRLICWRILRKWYGFFGQTGERLREQWIWKDQSGRDFKAPPFPVSSEFEAMTGRRIEFAEPIEPDLLPAFDERPAGRSRLVQGGIEVQVRSRAVDPWVLPGMERLRIKDLLSELEQDEAIDDTHALLPIQSSSLSFASTVVPIQNSLMFREGFIPSADGKKASTSSMSANSQQPASAFVPVQTALRAMDSLASFVQRRQPIILSSSASAGKTTILTELWTLLHQQPSTSNVTIEARRRGIVFINLADRSLDSKSLLGSLSSSPTDSSEAGTFSFIEGPLTRAVRQGRWLVLSAIDQASPEVLSVVKVLAERMHAAQHPSLGVGAAWGGNSSESNNGVGVRIQGGASKWVPAGKGFMLFATRTSNENTPPKFFGHRFWEQVWLERPQGDEVLRIVEGRYEQIRKNGLGQLLVSTWSSIAEVRAHDRSGGSARPIGVRELLRWCRRVDASLPRNFSLSSIQSNPTVQDEIFLDARDVFLGALPLPASAAASERYYAIVSILAASLSLSDERVESLLRRRTPDLNVPKAETAAGRSVTTGQNVTIGRVALPFVPSPASKATARPYALTKPSLNLMEKLGVCVKMSEPILMVGETGTGKTAAVGYLADLLGKRLTALNLSNQTEAGDLVGGYRPIDEGEEARRTAAALVNRFVDVFGRTVSLARNAEYVDSVKKAFEKRRWSRLVALWRRASQIAEPRIRQDEEASAKADSEGPRKRRKVEESLAELWHSFLGDVAAFELRHVKKSGKSRFIFSFVEGPLAKAIRDGDWILLDEVNLASSETLECLTTLLQTPTSSIVLTEQGQLEPIPRHPEFRLFACMNPATDVGKRDLPASLRSKFSELWVPPPDEDRDALVAIVQGYIGHRAVQDRGVIMDVAELYSAVKAMAIRAELADGSNQPPHFSMRTLARALSFAAEFAPSFGLRRALYEGFIMAFTMLLDQKSFQLVKAQLEQHIVSRAKNRGSMFAHVPSAPTGYEAIRFGPYWLQVGSEPVEDPEDYILTPSVQLKVLDLARAVLMRKVPILIQGPTSAGKTSVVEYLAKRTGHHFVRINNHEHTDIQEYLGSYVSDAATGKLVFQEGVLVRALRNGDWIVLDELNLAPTDVLEALNRLLDDNRELVIPETGEVVRPHPHFMLFATQNPPGLYGGRKVLSRAFRNRFLEMHFGDVPRDELETILCKRCQIAPSYAKKVVAVFVELQRRRQTGRVFEQKQAFATLRDLFRWGGRGSVGYQQLAEDGYMLLAERARRPDDKTVVKDVIEGEMRVKIDETAIYNFDRLQELHIPAPPAESGLVWTRAMRRLYVLIAAALLRSEPVLLVGETGSGKTSVCVELAKAFGRQVHTVSCHQNSESADLLGGQRPIRNRSAAQATLLTELREEFPGAVALDDRTTFDEALDAANALLQGYDREDKDRLANLVKRMTAATALFQWHDGPLIQAMRAGDFVLLDEISLADDSVLERLNSVLEPSRTLVLAEKGGSDLDELKVVGSSGFEILATMNPGGDFGKKEVSPALRNRFTEIWVPAVDTEEDLREIISSRWATDDLKPFGDKIIDFGAWLGDKIGLDKGTPGVSLRDILAWVEFINAVTRRSSAWKLDARDAFCQGAMLTSIDGLGASSITASWSKFALSKLANEACIKLQTLSAAASPPNNVDLTPKATSQSFSIGPFGISRGEHVVKPAAFSLDAPTTCLNAFRVLRSLQLNRPVLLEGSPGVGKTSLVNALAAASGRHLVRINLSDQTDLMDLFGSDLPVEGGRPGEFAWKDAAFLSAMQQGDWVLLDEMNLASQAVLEGLNSCLDHRGSVYIPELDKSFDRHSDFRIFAAQNPLGQGGGRKGLPRSFLDRFSIVYMAELNEVDLNAIARSQYPQIEPVQISAMIEYVVRLHKASMDDHLFASEGAPWEFNLRDVLRWLSLMLAVNGLEQQAGHPAEIVKMLFLQRFRNARDRRYAASMFDSLFQHDVDLQSSPHITATSDAIAIGHSLVHRRISSALSSCASLPIGRDALDTHEALVKALETGSLVILAGPSGTGKTVAARQAALLAGVTLVEFSMNAEVDTLELLGSFEQADRARTWREAAEAVKSRVESTFSEQLQSAAGPSNRPHALVSAVDVIERRLDSSLQDQELIEAVAQLEALCDDFDGELKRDAELIIANARSRASQIAGRFEWVDGPLVRAMKQGHWLLLEDANLCSPSVLDRLNSLFENNSVLQLAERGHVKGEIETVVAHPDFRMIMTLDPQHGELSRAMRNRGIELALIDVADFVSTSMDCFEDPEQQLQLITRDSHAPEHVSVTGLSTSPSAAPVLARLMRQLGIVTESLPVLSNVESQFVRRMLSQKMIISSSELVPIIKNQRLDPLLDAYLPSAGMSSEPDGVQSASMLVQLTLDALSSLAWVLREQATARTTRPADRTLLQQALMLSGNEIEDPDEEVRISGRVALLLRGASSFVLDITDDDWSSATIQTFGSQLLDLMQEFAHVVSGRAVDFGTLQQVVNWTRDIIRSAPASLQDRLLSLDRILDPLDQRLRLTTGLAMMSIWLACLPLSATSHRDYGDLSKAVDDQRIVPLDLLRVSLDAMHRMQRSSSLNDQQKQSLRSLSTELAQNLEALPAFDSTDRLGVWTSDMLFNLGSLAALSSETVLPREYLLAAGELIHLPLRELAVFDRAIVNPGENLGRIQAIASWFARANFDALSTLSMAPGLRLVDALPDTRDGSLANLESHRAQLLKIARVHALALHADVQEPLITLEQTLVTCRRFFLNEIDLFRFSSPGEKKTLEDLLDVHDTRAASSTSSVGQESLGFGYLMWRLFVPNIPIDPVVIRSARDTFLHRCSTRTQKLVDALSDAQQGLNGCLSNPKIQVLQSRVESLNTEARGHHTDETVRDIQPDLIASLYKELRAFEEQFLTESRLDGLTQALKHDAAVGLQRATNVASAIESLNRRLVTVYAPVEDVGRIVRFALDLVRVGLLLQVHEAQARLASKDIISTASFTRSLLQFPISARIDELASDRASVSPQLVSSADVAVLKLHITGLAHLSDPRGAVRLLDSLFRQLHAVWVREEERRQRQEEAQNSLYKSRTKRFDEIVDEEEMADELQSLFPTYEANESEAGAQTSRQTTTGPNGVPSSPSVLQSQHIVQIARLHLDLFRESSNLPKIFNSLDSHRRRTLRSLVANAMICLNNKDDYSAAVFRVASLAERLRQLDSTLTKDDHHPDFYTDANVAETSNAIQILRTGIQRLDGLIGLFPEQMVLRALRDRCLAILAFSTQSPIMKVLTALEQLLTQTEDWETFASREHSLAAFRGLLTGQIVQWRRLELSCWSRVLDSVQTRFEDSALEYWPRLLGLIMAKPEAGESAATKHDLAKLVEEYLANGSIGQFLKRLELIRAFGLFMHHVDRDDTSWTKEFSRILLNAHDLYGQFKPSVAKFVSAQRAALDKEVQNIIKLASWKDVNVYALRQSAVRSHHQLYKCIRKLREVLQKPASDQFILSPSTRQAVSTSPLELALPVTAELPAPRGSEMPSHLAQLDRTLARLVQVAKNATPALSQDSQCRRLDSFATEIVETAQALRSESLGATDDGRKQRIKSLISRKRRAWIELLRELKRIGLSPTPVPSAVAVLQDSSHVLSLQRPPFALDPMKDAQDYHLRLIRELPTLQKLPAEHHEDISTREIQRAIGSVQSCIYAGISACESLGPALESISHCSTQAQAFQALSSIPCAQIVQSASRLQDDLAKTTMQTLNVLHETKSALEDCAYIGMDADSLRAFILEQYETVGAFKTRVIDKSHAWITSEDDIASLSAQSNVLLRFKKRMEAFETAAQTAYIVQPLKTWAASLNVPLVERFSRQPASQDLDAIHTAHEEVINAVLVLVQQIHEIERDLKHDEESMTDAEFSSTLNEHRKTTSFLRIDELSSRFAHFAEVARPFIGLNSDVDNCVKRIAPFVSLYSQLASIHIESFARWYKTSLKLAYVVLGVLKDLAANGFCKPADADEDGEAGDDGPQGETTSGGTGMAAGKGETNVSKEIEDESQVEGLEGEEETERNPDDDQKDGDDDDAFEMGADFEGELGDRGDGAKDDEEGEDDDDEEEDGPDPDEQVADVDPLDPSTVDEKFWGDQEGPENSDKQDEKQDRINQDVQQQGESEMQAKEDGAAKESNAKKEDEAPAGEEDEAEGEDKGADDETMSDKDAGEAEKDDETAQQQNDGDRLDDHMPEAENLDLPEDMQLDEEDRKADDLESDLGSLPDDNVDDDFQARDEMKGNEPEDGAGSDAGDEQTMQDDQEDPAKAEDATETADGTSGGQEAGDAGADGGEDNGQDAEMADANETAPSRGAGSAARQDESSTEDVREGQESVQRDQTVDDEADKAQAAATGGTGPSRQQDEAQTAGDDAGADERSTAPQSRSLAQQVESFRRRLEQISEPSADPDSEEQGERPSKQPDAPESKGEVEYVPEGQEQEADENALGPAGDEQVKGIERLQIDDSEAVHDAAEMDVEPEAPSTLQAQSNVINLDSAAVPEGDSKGMSSAQLQSQRQREGDMADDEQAHSRDDHVIRPVQATRVDPEENETVEQAMLEWRRDEGDMTSEGVWRLYESLTRDLAYSLTEQLRLILEPTLATRLKGDYRSGKRLNMKKIIPYIASEFTKDKIWLRRTRPSQREYQVLIAIDDSKSMADSHSVHLAFQSLALITRALTRLEVGAVAVGRFGESLDMLHDFEAGSLGDDQGARLLERFTFAQQTTDVRKLVEQSLERLARAKATKASATSDELWQLEIIISDGVCQDHDRLRALLRQASQQKVMFVFVIVDSLHRRSASAAATVAETTQARQEQDNSILAMKSVSYVANAQGQMELKMERYLDTFPFEYFIVLRDVEALPEVLSSTLRQFFERVSSDR